MARLPRFVMPGQSQHVILRGNNRAEIFCADADYRFFLEKLQLACEKHPCDIHAYVLMTNHVHLLITPHQAQSLFKVMQMVGRYYVQYYNHHYQRTGTLWEGRYKATHPSVYPWSSYHRNAQGTLNHVVTPHLEYQRLGKTGQARHDPLIAHAGLAGSGPSYCRWSTSWSPPPVEGHYKTGQIMCYNLGQFTCSLHKDIKSLSSARLWYNVDNY